MKTGAAAIMAIATLSASAAAQDASAPAPSCATLWAHCVGPEPGDDATCCPGTQCVQKNQQYAQCRPVGETSPVEWMGNVITSKTMTDDPTEVADADTDEEPEPGLIMDAEDIVEMGMAPPGMDAEDLEEMGFEPGMDEEDMIELGIIPGEEDADATADDDGTGEEQVVGVMIGSLGDDASAPKASAPMPSEIQNEVVYKAVVGNDYSPSTDGTAKLVDVMVRSQTQHLCCSPWVNQPLRSEFLFALQNTGNKYEVASPAECEDLCTITSGCNAASYYLDGTPYGGPNCWLKTLANSCEMPADAEDDANAVFLLQLNPSCMQLLLSSGCQVLTKCVTLSYSQGSRALSPYVLCTVQASLSRSTLRLLSVPLVPLWMLLQKLPRKFPCLSRSRTPLCQRTTPLCLTSTQLLLPVLALARAA